MNPNNDRYTNKTPGGPKAERKPRPEMDHRNNSLPPSMRGPAKHYRTQDNPAGPRGGKASNIPPNRDPRQIKDFDRNRPDSPKGPYPPYPKSPQRNPKYRQMHPGQGHSEEVHIDGAPKSLPKLLLILVPVLLILALAISTYSLISSLKVKGDLKKVIGKLKSISDSQKQLSENMENISHGSDSLQGSINSNREEIAGIKQYLESQAEKNNQQNKNEENPFENLEGYLRTLGLSVTSEDADFANVLGASAGQRCLTPEGAAISVYSFDPNSAAYSEAVTNGYVMQGGTENIPATFAKGMALIIDETFPEREKILEDFNRLKSE